MPEERSLCKLVVFVPKTHLEEVKEAMFAAGAGRIGNYEACAWECPGSGQFRPLAGSNPAIGSEAKLERVAEYRVEMVCAVDLVPEVLRSLKRAHPYEEPAYDVWRLGL